MTFAHPFRVSGYDDELPAGDYEVVVDGEFVEELNFEAYLTMGSYLLIGGQTEGAGPGEMRQVDPRDLDAALARDRQRSGAMPASQMAHGARPPLEDLP